MSSVPKKHWETWPSERALVWAYPCRLPRFLYQPLVRSPNAFRETTTSPQSIQIRGKLSGYSYSKPGVGGMVGTQLERKTCSTGKSCLTTFPETFPEATASCFPAQPLLVQLPISNSYFSNTGQTGLNWYLNMKSPQDKFRVMWHIIPKFNCSITVPNLQGKWRDHATSTTCF